MNREKKKKLRQWWWWCCAVNAKFYEGRNQVKITNRRRKLHKITGIFRIIYECANLINLTLYCVPPSECCKWLIKFKFIIDNPKTREELSIYSWGFFGFNVKILECDSQEKKESESKWKYFDIINDSASQSSQIRRRVEWKKSWIKKTYKNLWNSQQKKKLCQRVWENRVECAITKKTNMKSFHIENLSIFIDMHRLCFDCQMSVSLCRSICPAKRFN